MSGLPAVRADQYFGVSVVDIDRIGVLLIREERALSNHLTRLRGTPLTVAQHFGAEQLDHGIDFPRFDAILAEAQAIAKRRPGALFSYEAGAQSFDMAMENFAAILSTAKPYRRHARP